MDANDAPPSRGNTLRRGKTLSRPERFQPAAPLLTGKKERKPLDPWVIFSRVVTFWIPSTLLVKFGGFHDKQSQQAWREKVTLCFIALIMSGIVAFLTVGLRPTLCPASAASNPSQFLRFGQAPGHLGILGWQFDISKALIPPTLDLFQLAEQQNGQDITNYFQRDTSSIPSCAVSSIQNFAAVTQPLCSNSSQCPLGTLSLSRLDSLNLVNTTKQVGYDWDQLYKLTNYLVVDGVVLNLDPYMNNNPDPIPNDIVDSIIRRLLSGTYANDGKDATRLFSKSSQTMTAMKCLIQKYYAGHIDKQTLGCFTADLFNYIMLVVILSVIFVRFFMACLFSWFISHRLSHNPKKVKKETTYPQVIAGSRKSRYAPWAHRNDSGTVVSKINMEEIGNDLYTVLLVTCYSEGEEGLRTTCVSLATTDYPDDRKLLFVICDGIITGSGNDKSTPDICISLLEIDEKYKNPNPQSYIAVAAGVKQHNRAKVYAGHFRHGDRRVPTLLIVKCGNADEEGKPKPGNRGKRDSQLILMNFFNRVTYNDRMTQLDYDLFQKVHHLMGVTPDFFELVLMVDADTKVYPDSLRLLVNCMCNDQLIMGLCGETKIANKRDSWVTAIQVFEYYVSHHLGKGFESVFGGVTCLPGCFCMYRLKARKGDDDWVPIITKPEIVQEYSQNVVNTLHQKNLLLLGEDRFLTTLMLRNFPYRKMTFCPQAVCKTVVPDEFNGTIVLPVAIILTFWLIISSILKPPKEFSEAIPLLMLAAVLGLPAILILLTTRKLIYITWMFVYLLALPVWNFVLPAYAYWHFDDFTWGETRKVEGESKGDDHGKKEGKFDPSRVPLKRWEDWERNRLNRLRRKERQRQQQAAGAVHPSYIEYDENVELLPSAPYDDTYLTETSSVASDSGQQQYYDYGSAPTTSYPPENYDRNRPEQFENVQIAGNTGGESSTNLGDGGEGNREESQRRI
ncbi:14737_t:CDS:2 [Acaulospora colombiana]|uniref:14737_t:CDS:1 n=1 Tax=Acaulospora colombiana TaxID=27376 RepID=A0ACA9K549_9GLOM|nr:14737_t:CDS:2 [Acaulospora colombiana]